MPGFEPALYLVATPIGNLSDITERARSILLHADRVYCEDTRQTMNLFRAMGDEKAPDLQRFDQHTQVQQIENWADQWIAEPKVWAVVTDAGTPGISDPGSEWVRVARSKNIPVIAIPGASSLVSFLSIAGMKAAEFAFLGFFPREKKDQKKLFEQMEKISEIRSWIFFESPKRLDKTLDQIAESFSKSEVRLVAAKELTKKFEKSWGGPVIETASQIKAELNQEGEVGEWVLGIEFEKLENVHNSEDPSWIKALDCLLEAKVSISDASKIISRQFHVPKNQVYDLALQKK